MMPVCWKCSNRIVKEKKEAIGPLFIRQDGQSVQLVGCAAEKKIKNYAMAQTMCPLLKQGPATT